MDISLTYGLIFINVTRLRKSVIETVVGMAIQAGKTSMGLMQLLLLAIQNVCAYKAIFRG